MNQPNNWEEEFDKNLQWVEIDGLQIKFVTMKNTYIDLKSFVRKTISQQRKETVETIESMKRPCNCMTTTKKHAIVCSTQDTRQHKMETKFLDNIITKLSEEK